jgi:hypothetical protein
MGTNKNELQNDELNEKIKKLIKSQVIHGIPSDFHVYYHNKDFVLIMISITNDPDDKKYGETKATLLRWEKALINLINLEFKINIKELKF